MRKKISICLAILFAVVFITGCGTKTPIKLDDKFYNSTEYIQLTGAELNDMQDSDSSYLIYLHNDNCTLVIPFKEILDKYVDKYHISFYNMRFEEFKDTYMHDEVKYAPSVIIVSKGKVIDYLNADKDEDYERYQDVDKFAEWLNSYIEVEDAE